MQSNVLDASQAFGLEFMNKKVVGQGGIVSTFKDLMSHRKQAPPQIEVCEP